MEAKPILYYRLFTMDKKGAFHLFETNQFGEPNNWFDTIDEADKWIQGIFDDSYPRGVDDPAARVSPELVLIALPVWVLSFRRSALPRL